ncbi:MAG: hypothetical protein MJ016_08360, partial [Victivallaceae bacterium]|nr:hypothetical protein [Victivallaceae bacterium]
MANYFHDNPDLKFTLENLELAPISDLIEDGYRAAEKYETAPRDATDALDNYRRALEVVGEVCADRIEPRARTV